MSGMLAESLLLLALSGQYRKGSAARCTEDMSYCEAVREALKANASMEYKQRNERMKKELDQRLRDTAPHDIPPITLPEKPPKPHSEIT
jgi:hypothetical protein